MTQDEITPISSRIAYQNRWLRVREDIVRRQDGSEGLYGVVERPEFVAVVALQDGRVTMVEQYR
jgi:ADP-ribose pyrophosphatase